jgi:uncharacterized membrane protein (Fun14 family)
VAKLFESRTEKPARPGELLRKGRSPFSAKSVWLAAGLFIGSAGAMLSGPATGTIASWFHSLSASVMPLAGSYLAGFFIGWGARRTIKLTTIIAGIALAVIGLFVSWGWDGSMAQSWVNSATAWVDESVEGAGRYLVSLLPSAAAAGAGGVLGFRRK